jgi:hypothetical protein
MVKIFPLTFHFLAEWSNGVHLRKLPRTSETFIYHTQEQRGEGRMAVVGAAFCAKNSKFCKSLSSCVFSLQAESAVFQN